MGIIRSRADVSSLSDTELVRRSRSGDTRAFAELWNRHAGAGQTVARSYTSTFDADDLVAESYAKIFQAITSGGGPTGAFRPYLFTTIRNTAASWGRAKRDVAIEEIEQFEDPAFSEENSLAALDKSLTATAFRSLPTRWQEALWYSEVESMTPQEMAPLLGMKANGVAALTYRAREGLRQAWIQAHLSSVPADSECRWTIDRLGAYARNGLGKRDTARLDTHLSGCAKCTIVAAEAKDVGSRLALVLLPIAAGVAGAAGYNVWLQTGGSTAAYALGASGTVMPAAAIGGAGGSGGVVTGAGGSATGAGGSATGAGAAGGAAAGAGAAGAGAATGTTGVVVGSVVAGALVAAGVTAAIALGPTLFGSPPQNEVAAPPAAGSTEAPSDTTPSPIPSTPQSPTPSAPPPAAASEPTGTQIQDAAVDDATQPADSAPPSSTPPQTPTEPTEPSTPAGPQPPAAPGVGTPALTPDGQLTLAGSGVSGNTVTATAQPDASTAARGSARAVVMPSQLKIGTTTVGADGEWAISADLSGYADGSYTLSIVQTNGPLSSPAATRELQVSITPASPMFQIDTGGAKGTSGLYFPIISGSAKPGSSIAVHVGELALEPIRVGDSGRWASAEVDGLPAQVEIPVSVVETDSHGRTSAPSQRSFTLEPPRIIKPHEGEWIIYAPHIGISVAGEQGARVSVFGSDEPRQLLGTIDIADGKGTFELPFSLFRSYTFVPYYADITGQRRGPDGSPVTVTVLISTLTTPDQNADGEPSDPSSAQ